jgi:membrane protein implicated in regulation of membrane protease activity
MLTLYLILTLAGGALVAISVFAGNHGDAGADGDAGGSDHGSADHGHGHGHTHGFGDLAAAYLPFTSLRFWTFAMAFGGLTGAVLTGARLGATVPVAIAAGVVGYLAGLGVTRLVAHLGKRETNSRFEDADLVGASAEVLLPIEKGEAGRVRVTIGGRLVDRPAVAEGDLAMPVGARVLVFAVREDGTLSVSQDPT